MDIPRKAHRRCFGSGVVAAMALRADMPRDNKYEMTRTGQDHDTTDYTVLTLLVL